MSAIYVNKISNTITVIIAVIGTYLLGSKVVYKTGDNQEIKTEFSQSELLNFDVEEEQSDEDE